MRIARPIFFFALLAGFGLSIFPSSSQAQQISNRPYNFSRGGGSGGGMSGGGAVGMSPAYRQLILQRAVTGQQPGNPILRDSSGALVEVTRFDNQAFVSAQAAPFLVGSRGLGILGGSGLGVGPITLGVLGGGGYSGFGGHDLFWIGQLYGGAGATAVGYPSEEMDSWMYQLNGLRYEG